jgi:uncharacterized protein
MITSPCTNICDIDPSTSLCMGCARTLDEIARWGSVTDQERLDILNRIEARKPLVKPPLAC